MDAEQRNELGRRVREARKARRFTQQELADEAGVSFGTINNLENGKSVPQGANRRNITKALGVDVFDEGIAQLTRDLWPPDVQVFADALGQFLASLEPEARANQVAKWMSDIMSSRSVE